MSMPQGVNPMEAMQAAMQVGEMLNGINQTLTAIYEEQVATRERFDQLLMVEHRKMAAAEVLASEAAGVAEQFGQNKFAAVLRNLLSE